MPKNFTQIIVHSFGGPEALEVAQTQSLPLQSGQLRIQMEAVGVNRADVLIRKGLYHRKQLPATPGLEGCGIVTESSCTIPVGTKVIIFDGIGLYQEEVVVDESEVITVPHALPSEIGASLPVNWLTAWYCIHNLLQLKPKDFLLLTASASGVGTAAIQIAKQAGFQVIAAASSADKLETSRKLGADFLIDYSQTDLTEEATRISGGKGVQGALDIIGGNFFRPVIKSLTTFGKMVSLANVTTEDSVVNTRDFYPKNISIHGFQLGSLLSHKHWDPRPSLKKIVDGVLEGNFTPVIYKTFPLEQAAEAHRTLESRQVMGKVILKTTKGAPS